MKNNLLTLATILTIGFFTNNVTAQKTQTVQATATARIITPITLTKGNSLDFGMIVTGASAGTLEITTGDSRGEVTGITTISSTVTAASFTVGGESDRTYSIDLPADGTVVVKTGAGDTDATKMELTGFKTAASLTTNSVGTAGAFKVGATINVKAAGSQTVGTYTGTFPVTVTYN